MAGRPEKKAFEPNFHAAKSKNASSRRQPIAPSRVVGSILRALVRKISVWLKRSREMAHGVLHKMFPAKSIASKRRTRVVLRFRFALIAGSVAVVVVVLLLVLFAPGRSAASGSSPLAALQEVPDAPASMLIPTTPPYPEIDVVPTTEPDISVTPQETAAPTQTVKPSSTPSPSSKPTTAASPTPKPTTESTPTPAQVSETSGGNDLDSRVAFFVVDADSYYNDVGYSTNHYDYTDEELYILAQIIQTEAGGESDDGKIAAGNVVINRVLCGRWGSSVAAVSGGFAYHPDTVPKQGAINAAHAVLDDEVWRVPQNTYYFKTSGGSWRTFTFWNQIGNHYFYTYNYSGRYNGTSIPPALFERTYRYAQYGCKPAERVKRIQAMLIALNYDIASADGYFGEGTKNALMAFQQEKGLTADGVAGPSTIEALINTFGVENYCNTFQ